MTSTSKDVMDRQRAFPFRYYDEELPEGPEGVAFEAGLQLIETYTGLPRDEVRRHVKTVRNKAFAIYQYPCLGRWRFLPLYLSGYSEYQNILTRLKSGEKLLDAGCCFGHTLRQLALGGVPSENLAGVDIDKGFIDLGYELFQDRDRFKAQFVVGDVLNSSASLEPLYGQFDIINASSFFHLFGWDDQVTIGQRLVRFFKPEADKAMIVGRQVGAYEAQNLEEWREQAKVDAATRRHYRHDLASWQLLWDEVGAKTGTKWETGGELIERSEEDVGAPFLHFVVKLRG